MPYLPAITSSPNHDQADFANTPLCRLRPRQAHPLRLEPPGLRRPGDPCLLGIIAAVVEGGTSILGGEGGYLGTIAGAILLVMLRALITVINASPA